MQHLKTALGIMLRGYSTSVKRFLDSDSQDEEDNGSDQKDMSPVDFVVNYIEEQSPKPQVKTR